MATSGHIDIYKNEREATSVGEVLLNTAFEQSSEIRRVLMGDNYVKLVFNSTTRVVIPTGSYIVIEDEKMRVYDDYYPVKIGDYYHYEVLFHSKDYWLRKTIIKFHSNDLEELSFALTSEPINFLNIVAENVSEILQEADIFMTCEVGGVDDNISSLVKTISFNGENCFDAMNLIAETYDTEWYSELIDRGGYTALVLHLKKNQVGSEYLNLSSFEDADDAIRVDTIEAQQGDNSLYGNRFYVYGSTKNLTREYGEVNAGATINMISEIRLRLPNNQAYIEVGSPNVYERVEKVVYFDDIYPKSNQTIDGVSTREEDDHYLFDLTTDITSITLAEGEKLTILFTSGNLNGMEFDVNKDSFDSDGVITLIPNNNGSQDEPLWVPNTTFAPSIGDVFVLKGIVLPQDKIEEAENELLSVAQEYASKNSKNTDVYSIKTDPTASVNLTLGSLVIVNGVNTRIREVTKTLANPYRATYLAGDNNKYSRLNNISNQGSEAEYSNRIGVIGGGGNGVVIIRNNDINVPTDTNVYSALRVKSEIKSIEKKIESNSVSKLFKEDENKDIVLRKKTNGNKRSLLDINKLQSNILILPSAPPSDGELSEGEYAIYVDDIGEGAESPESSSSTIGELINVDTSADNVHTEDVVLIKEQGSDMYKPKALSDIQGSGNDLLEDSTDEESYEVYNEETLLNETITSPKLIKKHYLPIYGSKGVQLKIKSATAKRVNISLKVDEDTFGFDEEGRLQLLQVDGGSFVIDDSQIPNIKFL